MEKLLSGAGKLGLQLSSEQLQQFETYYRELIDWNKRLNLTAITDYEDVQLNHFLDALTVVLAWQPDKGDTRLKVIDVGTGNGIPGIPLKIAFTEIELTLLESTTKKVAFLRHLIDQLKLGGTEIVAGRAEEVAHDSRYRESFDLVLSRAVAPLPTLAELTLPFCTVGGSMVVHKKGDIEEELRRASQAIDTLGGRLREVRALEIPELPDQRRLVVIGKISTTPEQYPRRPGIPKKRPIS
ncbi:MAG TPA: 16S rRNA (guanine(527)-N(7))-methyltransferase RsmG [Dehalococcoidia bacterium]|nr:16S rRNA (guanine(527)-N(7))-methyltransferase RsmG [Dehalococcoidia bacterium]